jgi:N-acetylglucosaminyldiphosphoundecaprenol N-acetyl-beta-D-mannosaminyltransferase
MKRIHISGVPIDITTAEDAARWVLDRIQKGVRTSVAAVNAAIVVMATRDQCLCGALRKFDVVIADGAWTALAASFLFRRRVPHTNTSPFLRALFRDPGPEKLRVFLLGARPEVIARAAVRLSILHPTVTVVGYEHGYFNTEDEDRIVESIEHSGAQILLIGISTPKKELFIRRHWSRLNVPIAFGIGGLVDIWGGQTSEAPEWVRNCGFEWLFRLVQEPKRLWRRYTVDGFAFLRIVLRQALGMQ